MAAFGEWKCGRDYRVIDDRRGGALLFIAGNHRALRIDADLGTRLRIGLDQLTPAELAEWDILSNTGVVSTVNSARVAQTAFSDGSNLAINVNLTAVCNLGCSYCFAEGGDYGRIKGKLGSDIGEDIFRFIEERVSPGQAVRFEFFGGEPLLNYTQIAAMCARAEEISSAKGIRFINRISTNLTVLPPGAAELFARHRFIVSISIDGDRHTHDRNRPTKGGKGSWEKIIRNCYEVRAAGEEITMVARMTVVGEVPPLIDNVRALWGLNLFDYFQIYPGVVPREKSHIFGEQTPDNPGTTMNVGFLKQLAALLEEYPKMFGGNNRFRGVLEYERIVDMVVQGKAALSFCSGGRNYFTFSPDHSIMPCHRLVGDTSMQVGTSAAGLSGTGLDVWRLPIDSRPVCSQCWIRYICAGGCRQENLQATGDLNVPSEEGCTYQIKLVEGVLGMLASQEQSYATRDRLQLDDMFVSCGRPMVVNLRRDPALPALRHFRPL